MVEGIYSITFRGYADWGMGLLILQEGVIVGADIGGVLYDGTYVENSNTIETQLTLTVPPGVTLAMGTEPQPKAYSVELESVIPKQTIETHEPHRIDTKLGPVNVIFQKLRDLPKR